MAGSKDNAPIEIVNKAIQKRFGTDFAATGSKKDEKGCDLWYIGGNYPVKLHSFTKNADCLHIAYHPDFEPLKPWPKRDINLFSDLKISTGKDKQHLDAENILSKTEKLRQELELYPVPGIPKENITGLKKIITKLKHRK